MRRIVRTLDRGLRFLFSLPLGFLIHPKRVASPLPLAQVHSVLILRYDALGDAVLSSAVWHSIKKYAPHIRIGVVGSRRNHMLLRTDPAIDDVFVFSKALAWHIIPDLLRARRAARWDMVLNISFHDKTRAAIYSRIVAPDAVTVTSAWDKQEKYRRMYSIVGQREQSKPIVLEWLNVLDMALDVNLTHEDTLPHLYADPVIARSFGREIAERLKRAGQTQYLILNTNAAQAFREWDLEHALALSLELRRRYPELHIFWITAPERSEMVRDLLEATAVPEIEYLPTPSVYHLLVAIEGARYVISPDTSVVHIAAAYRRPIVGLYVERNEFPIRGTVCRMVFALDGRRVESITVESVLDAFDQVVQEASTQLVGERN